MAKEEKDKKNEIAPKAEDSKKEKVEEEETDASEENLVEEEKEAEAEGKERDYNSIFDDDYNPNSDKDPESKEEDDEGESEEQEKEGAEVPAESVGEETDDVQEAKEAKETQAREKSKEPSPKKSSNDKKKDESKKDKSEDNKEKAKKNDDEIVLDNHKDKSGKGNVSLAKKILIALAIILALLAGAFGGYLYFKSTNKPKEEPAPVKTEEPKEEETKKEVYVTAEGGLNLRENPDSSSKSLAVIPNGTKLTVLEEKDGWYKVEYDGEQGWVSKDFVSEQKPDDWKTYSGSGFSPEGPKFSIKYPSDWEMTEGYRIRKTDNGKKYMIALGEGGHGLNEGGDTGITTSSEDVTYNGLPATKIVAKNQGNIFLIVGQFKKGDASVQIEFNLPEGYDQSYIDMFDKMLNTFKFL